MRIIDQYMGFYTPLVLLIGALVWAFTFDLSRVIAVLIVACPCAFILATPSAMVAALSAAARLGILIKNVGDIELAARINAFIFDKTGTLTTGRLAVSRLQPMHGATPAELLRVAASAEKYSNHPTAKALAQLAGEAGVPVSEPKDFAEAAGRGVSARVEGAEVLVGRAQWLKEQGVAEDFLKSVDLNETEGFSLIFVARGGKCLGWIGLQDQTRAEAREALADLKTTGVRRIAMVSGDRQPVAARAAQQPQKKQLHLVAGMMGQRDRLDFLPSRGSRQERVPQFPRRHFQGQLRFRGERLHVRASGEDPQLHRGGGFADEPFIRVAGASAQPVVEMRDRNSPPVPWSEQMENVQQNHRIHAAGNGDKDFLPGREQPAALDFAFDALEKLAHAPILLFLDAPGKRPDHCDSRSR